VSTEAAFAADLLVVLIENEQYVYRSLCESAHDPLVCLQRFLVAEGQV